MKVGKSHEYKEKAPNRYGSGLWKMERMMGVEPALATRLRVLEYSIFYILCEISCALS